MLARWVVGRHRWTWLRVLVCVYSGLLCLEAGRWEAARCEQVINKVEVTFAGRVVVWESWAAWMDGGWMSQGVDLIIMQPAVLHWKHHTPDSIIVSRIHLAGPRFLFHPGLTA